jgi:hypothetical protein
LGEKMDFVPVCLSDERSHAIIEAALSRGRPVSGHVYGREFVAAYAAAGVTDTHEAIDREIADDLLEAGIWVFLRGGPPTTPWHSLPEAIKTITELGASHQADRRVHRRPRRRRPSDVRPGLGHPRGDEVPASNRKQPGRWARCMARHASAWKTKSAASAADGAPTLCCSTTIWSR